MTAESSPLALAEIISAFFRIVSSISSHILSAADSSRVLPDNEEREQHQEVQQMHVRELVVLLLLCSDLLRTYV